MQKIIDCLKRNYKKIMSVFNHKIERWLLLMITNEECSELIQALSKHERALNKVKIINGREIKSMMRSNKTNDRSEELNAAVEQYEKALDNLAEEIADVLICIEWTKKIAGLSDEVINGWIEYKADRISDRTERGEFY